MLYNLEMGSCFASTQKKKIVVFCCQSFPHALVLSQDYFVAGDEHKLPSVHCMPGSCNRNPSLLNSLAIDVVALYSFVSVELCPIWSNFSINRCIFLWDSSLQSMSVKRNADVLWATIDRLLIFVEV